jgi:hypothetical protein
VTVSIAAPSHRNDVLTLKLTVCSPSVKYGLTASVVCSDSVSFCVIVPTSGMGTEMCAVKSCTSPVYRKSQATTAVRGKVACQKATNAICVVSLGPLSHFSKSTAAVAPAVPRAAAPAAPAAPSTTAPVTPAAPLPAAPVVPAAPLPAAPVVPATLPVPVRIAIGKTCSAASAQCIDGATCSCQSRCAKTVRFNYTAAADDMGTFKMPCSDNILSSKWPLSQTATYEGACTDMFIVQSNNNGLGGFIMALEHQGTTYSTGSVGPGGNALTPTFAKDILPGYETNASYDFSSWQPVLRTTAWSSGPSMWQAIRSTYGAETVSVDANGLHPLGSTMTYRVRMPFC